METGQFVQPEALGALSDEVVLARRERQAREGGNGALRESWR